MIRHSVVATVQAEQFKLLAVLAERQGTVQSREQLLWDVWKRKATADRRTVDTHVRQLLDKLGPAANCIHTIRGFGYRFNGNTY